jgi:hypothetical protein
MQAAVVVVDTTEVLVRTAAVALAVLVISLVAVVAVMVTMAVVLQVERRQVSGAQRLAAVQGLREMQ